VRERAEIEAIGQILSQTSCDGLLLDLQMDRWSMDDIPRLAQTVSVIVLTASESVENAILALRRGARAVVQKRFAIETLTNAITAVADGQVWMPPNVQAAILQSQTPSASNSLTGREIEVLRLVALGLRNSEVAERLRLSENTVKTHLTNVFQKLDIRDRVGLTHYAIRTGLINLDR
jgi:DNA-binding NarL/FixJ family response regulator